MKNLAVLAVILLVLLLLLSCAPKSESPAVTSPTPAPAPMLTPAPTQPTESAPAAEEKEAEEKTPPPATTTTTTTSPTTPTPTPTTPSTTPAPTLASIVWTTPAEPVTLTVDTAANRATYRSGGVEISGYFYKPSGRGPFPALLVLHGKSGLGTSIRDRTSWFAAKGYVAFAPNYFAPVGMTAEKFNVSFYKNNVDQVREILGQGLEALKSLSYVDSNHLGDMVIPSAATFLSSSAREMM